MKHRNEGLWLYPHNESDSMNYQMYCVAGNQCLDEELQNEIETIEQGGVWTIRAKYKGRWVKLAEGNSEEEADKYFCEHHTRFEIGMLYLQINPEKIIRKQIK